MIRKFTQYVKFREAENASGSIFLNSGEGEHEPIKLAWKRYKNQTITFLHDLNDSEIEDALKKIEDDGTNDEDKHRDDRNDEIDSVVVPKADGSPGMEDEGGGE